MGKMAILRGRFVKGNETLRNGVVNLIIISRWPFWVIYDRKQMSALDVCELSGFMVDRKMWLIDKRG